jgi:hypothetical protein
MPLDHSKGGRKKKPGRGGKMPSGPGAQSSQGGEMILQAPRHSVLDSNQYLRGIKNPWHRARKKGRA